MPQFSERGQRLWEVLAVSDEFSPRGILAVEACRMADRLDAMAGDPFLAQEARLTAGALKALLESPLLKASEAKGASPIDALAARRTARRSTAAGS